MLFIFPICNSVPCFSSPIDTTPRESFFVPNDEGGEINKMSKVSKRGSRSSESQVMGGGDVDV